MNKPTRHRETRTILAISLPLIAAYVAEMGMMITDMIIVGRLGSNELAGSLIFPPPMAGRAPTIVLLLLNRNNPDSITS